MFWFMSVQFAVLRAGFEFISERLNVLLICERKAECIFSIFEGPISGSNGRF